ncbi:MAG: DUF1232 domain-containing protein [Clostridium sp.]|nr:DUF1232 domain-containing protein [Clostridium sp.]
MRVTSVTTTLSAEDILFDLKTLVEPKVPELEVSTIILEDNYIEIKGSYKKGVTIPFLARVKIVSVINNIMTLKIEKVRVLKIGIPKFILNLASKTAAKKAEEMGVYYSKENKNISVNIETILSEVPHVHLIVDEFTMDKGLLTLKIKSIEADLDAMEKERNKDKIEEERIKREKEEKRIREFNRKLGLLERTEDSYTGFRNTIYRKVPFDKRNIADYALILPDLYALAFRLLKDKRVARRDKILIGFTFGYPLLPIDIIPKKFPIIGRLDDLYIVLFGADHILRKIPLPIIVKNWQGDLNILKQVRDNIDMIIGFTPGKNLSQAYEFVDNSLDNKNPSYLNDEYYLTPEIKVVEKEEPAVFTPDSIKE